mmetsp:Transcript_60911/g.135728  ORF Transcript_60911/g.135728 Transcript_60911/m.135728 type:complete len:210 (+) Transcript_60911:174-803(+)
MTPARCCGRRLAIGVAADASTRVGEAALLEVHHDTRCWVIVSIPGAIPGSRLAFWLHLESPLYIGPLYHITCKLCGESSEEAPVRWPAAEHCSVGGSPDMLTLSNAFHRENSPALAPALPHLNLELETSATHPLGHRRGLQLLDADRILVSLADESPGRLAVDRPSRLEYFVALEQLPHILNFELLFAIPWPACPFFSQNLVSINMTSD